MQRLASALSDDQEAAADRAIELAGGNPFFLEEILAMSGEGGRRRCRETVQGVIAARLDLLTPEEKRCCSGQRVIGRTFSRVVAGALNRRSRPPRRLLANLSGRDLLTPLARRPGFKHVLIRDVAYESIAAQRAGRGCTCGWPAALEGAGDTEPRWSPAHYAAAGGAGRAARRARTPCGCCWAAPRGAVGVRPRAGPAAGRAGPALADDETRAGAGGSRPSATPTGWPSARTRRWTPIATPWSTADAAGLDARATARLRWKWVDLRTRWTGGMPLRGAAPRDRDRCHIDAA